MKYKIIIAALSVGVLLGASSCEGMLKTDSTVVLFDSDDNIKDATDTVYMALGIEQKMQKIADRTVLLGELRGDLISTTDHATSDLKNISSFSFDKKNEYNAVVDYYAIINNCNYYLAKADTTYVRGGKKIFLNEYIAILSLRAWTYIQLCQVYGKVPFVTVPIVSNDLATLANFPLKTIKEIALELIPQLVGYEDTPFPNYSTLGDKKVDSRKFFIPVRLILGDLYLWAGEGYYEKAAQCYHDYLSSLKSSVTTGLNDISWIYNSFRSISDSYVSLFNVDRERDKSEITFIPMESREYDGITSNLDDVFNSTEDNYYYNQIVPSVALRKISRNQVYCFHYFAGENTKDTIYVVDPSCYSFGWEVYDGSKMYYYSATNLKTNEKDTVYSVNTLGSEPNWNRRIVLANNSITQKTVQMGDLRLYATYNESPLSSSSDLYNTSSQRISKVKVDRICLYRNDVVYLRLAEALNRAGLPQMAFAVLKYGLSETSIENYVCAQERAKAAALGLDVFDPLKFYQPTLIYGGGTETSHESGTTIGIHSRGSGDAAANKLYKIPACSNLADSIEAVEKMILDEMALETCFEGYRFGDILRVSMHRAEKNGGFADNAFFASKISERDPSLSTKLNKGGNVYNSNWFLPLPK